jgi:hypothetical protein
VPEIDAGHLTDELPIAQVPQLGRPEVPLNIARKPVSITNYHLTEFL